MTTNINGAVEVNHQDAMLLARKAHEAMMKEGRGMHLWGGWDAGSRGPGILRPLCCACCRS